MAAPASGASTALDLAQVLEAAEVEQAFRSRRAAWKARQSCITARVGAAVALLMLGLGAACRGATAKLHHLQAALNLALFCALSGGYSRSSRAPRRRYSAVLMFSLLHLLANCIMTQEALSALFASQVGPLRALVAEVAPWARVLMQGILLCVVQLAGLPFLANCAFVHLAVLLYGILPRPLQEVPESPRPGATEPAAPLPVPATVGWIARAPVLELYVFALMVLAVRWYQERQERVVFTHGFLASTETTVSSPEQSEAEDTSEKEDKGRRVTTAPHPPMSLVRRLSLSPVMAEATESGGDPGANAALVAAMGNATANLPRLRQICSRMWDEDYDVEAYFNDCVAAFPELQLFFVGCKGDKAASSGVTNELEYQRTIGALFTVYWLLRLNIDGRVGFCYGVDNNWKPIKPDPTERRRMSSSSSSARHGSSRDPINEPASIAFKSMDESQKRASFLETMQWALFEDLICQAGCDRKSENVQERLMALLVITAIHDIMKVEALLPVVQPQHAPYLGYPAGVVIRDHDIAIGYVMKHFPELLPSYAALPPAAQAVALFSQGQMSFNHGWFVQAEAPPGGMLSTLKSVLKQKNAAADIGFYFLHWFTDLAGAAATPKGGAEKFVLHFPQALLASFLWSIPFLGKLATNSETEVMEIYLKARWRVILPDKPCPANVSAIACMRLVVMAQSDGTVAEAFQKLPATDRWTLITELSRTGCKEQSFSMCEPHCDGPAFMVYYGPALLQKNAESAHFMYAALRVLAEVYRVAREMWPLEQDQEDMVVTVQVAELKTKTVDCVIDQAKDDGWYLVRHNDREGAVKWLEEADREALAAGVLCAPLGFKAIPMPTPDPTSPKLSHHSINQVTGVEDDSDGVRDWSDDSDGDMEDLDEFDHRPSMASAKSMTRIPSNRLEKVDSSGTPSSMAKRKSTNSDSFLPFETAEGSMHPTMDSGMAANLRQENWLLRDKNASLMEELTKLRATMLKREDSVRPEKSGASMEAAHPELMRQQTR